MSIEVEVGGVYEKAADLTPTGTVSAFAGTTAPSGWLLCDGSAVNRQTYVDLYDVIGISFGYGDNNTTFNLPDLRGQFIRGRDGGAGIDPDASSREALNTGGNTGDNIGSKQDSAMWGHWHNYYYAGDAGDAMSGTSYTYDKLNITPSSSKNYKVREAISDGSHDAPNISGESRPKNVALNYIIKT